MNESTKTLVVSKKINKEDKYIPGGWLKKLYEAVDNPRDKAYIMFHAETGLRVSDIVGVKKKGGKRLPGIEVHNIDWENNRVYTYDHKKDKWRWVYFPEKVRSVLKMYLLYRQKAGIRGRELFCMSEKTCNRVLKRWCKRIGFPYADLVGSHWLRHTFIRLSRRAGRDIKAVQQNTGDSVKTILEWYSELDREAMRQELDEKPLI